MEFADILSRRIEGENELKKPVNALICFSKVKTGKAYLRSSISGKSKDYSIEIEKVFFHEKNS